ncbi:MAG: 23S rRNA (pseudouridine(1915)-N(3))-methyltransferase RlmH [DPANN group archaeon]|nr:23S rRNA (pseudouridine(1915)-N(3))-methyltransferase RlmH [DPANN group archaeon]
MRKSIQIIAIGKNQEMFKSSESEYISRIERYSTFNLIELKEHNDKNPSETVKKEGQEILKKLDSKTQSKIYAFDVSGDKIDSVGLSKLLDSDDDLTFLIGGSDGFSDDVKKKADKLISISSMTFTHQLARVLILEQIYRGFTILNNEKYHK